ncbi:MAG: hypothetical protein A3F46_10830 [Legionellales bacterium RIFCSPHIGHO2_12_FULL_42_9]|nr:MAG: hypothetical protein A3F46_10830 [Legionellales bacterium RIFCSPHIGHO2_12_FULL_42_9]
MMIGAACVPSAVELISGFVSLGQSLYHKVKSKPNLTAEGRARAGEYFQDAVTRFALVIPLAMVSLAAVPAEFIRFFTRCIATLVHLASRDHSPARLETSEQTSLLQEESHASVAADPSM